MFERFTSEARAVLVMAQEEARGLHHNFIGTEHMLLGLLHGDDEVVSAVVVDLTLDEIREEVIELIGPGDEAPGDRPPFTPRAKKVMELSLREALTYGHNFIAPYHILLALLREGEGVAAQILGGHGIDHDAAAAVVSEVVGARPRDRKRRMRRRDIGAMAANVAVFTNWSAPAQRVGWAGVGKRRFATSDLLLALLDEPDSLAAKALAALGVDKAAVEAKIAEIGVDGTSDAPPKPRPGARKITLAEGVEIRVTDPELASLVDSGTLEELLAEVVRRSKSA